MTTITTEDLVRQLRAAVTQTQRAGPDNLRAASLVLAAIADRAGERLGELERLEKLEAGNLIESGGERIDRCPYCGNSGCVCDHKWGESCRCRAAEYDG